MDFGKMPKVDLHYHLDGSVGIQTLLDVAKNEGVILPSDTIEGLRKFVQVEDSCTSLSEYLTKFEIPNRCMQSKWALDYISYKAVEEAWKQNIKYMEVRFAPSLHTENGLSLNEVIESVLAGLQRAETNFDVVARGIIICLRGEETSENQKVVEAAIAFLGKGVVGLDLAGNEAAYPPAEFRSLFESVKETQIPITIHAGEAAGPESIRDAIEILGAKRIGHGVSARYDEEVLQTLRDKGIGIELCLTSNVQTKAVQRISEHPIRMFFDRGLKVSINTDNTTVSATCITEEYRKVAEAFDFSDEELFCLVMNAVEMSFVDEQTKLRVKDNILRDWRR